MIYPVTWDGAVMVWLGIILGCPILLTLFLFPPWVPLARPRRLIPAAYNVLLNSWYEIWYYLPSSKLLNWDLPVPIFKHSIVIVLLRATCTVRPHIFKLCYFELPDGYTEHNSISLRFYCTFICIRCTLLENRGNKICEILRIYPRLRFWKEYTFVPWKFLDTKYIELCY